MELARTTSAAAPPPPRTRLPREIPPLWLLVAIAAMLALHFAWPLARVVPWPWTQFGWVLQAAAMVVMLAGLRRFVRIGTGVRPFSPVRGLVVDGPYRWTRNPMYVGLVAVTVGIALCLGTLSPWLVPPSLFAVLDRRFVRREEIFLREHFGDPYVAYCADVRRWL